jgi:hypothetical protein
MAKVSFNINTQPWDSLIGQVLEGSWAHKKQWTDAATGTIFEITKGRMWIEQVINLPVGERYLMFGQGSEQTMNDPNDPALLTIRFPNKQTEIDFLFQAECHPSLCKIFFCDIGPHGSILTEIAPYNVIQSIDVGNQYHFTFHGCPFNEIWIYSPSQLAYVNELEFKYSLTYWEKFSCIFKSIWRELLSMLLKVLQLLGLTKRQKSTKP